MNNIPRRSRLDLLQKEEIAIITAVQLIEEMGSSPILTESVILLQKARDLVSDYIDETKLEKSGTGNACDEYAKEFAEWCSTKNYSYNLSTKSWTGLMDGNFIGETTDTLLNLFLGDRRIRENHTISARQILAKHSNIHFKDEEKFNEIIRAMEEYAKEKLKQGNEYAVASEKHL